ncbi:unnamed protein product [Closterium sp. Naga37s-1]|nr:unnamed protein product [Closterium sp. Naga37s-1]
MEPSSVADNSEPADTQQTEQAAPSTPRPAPETQESQLHQATNTPGRARNDTLLNDPTWWGNNLPSPSDSYDEDEDLGVGEEVADAAPPGTQEEQPANASNARDDGQPGTSCRSDARTTCWQPEEEWELICARWDLDDRIRAQTGQQGRSWYVTMHRELVARLPEWRHDANAIKAKINRMRDTYLRWRDKGVRRSRGPSPASCRSATPPRLYAAFRIGSSSAGDGNDFSGAGSWTAHAYCSGISDGLASNARASCDAVTTFSSDHAFACISSSSCSAVRATGASYSSPVSDGTSFPADAANRASCDAADLASCDAADRAFSSVA